MVKQFRKKVKEEKQVLEKVKNTLRSEKLGNLLNNHNW